MKIKYMTKAALLSLAMSFTLTSCNDWLDLLPNNEQVTANYWQSKEEVENVVASGYYYMRECVPTLINWGELRSDNFYNDRAGVDATKLQDFDILSTNSLCDYAKFYQVISMANSVIKYAPGVRSNDKTYYESMMKSHLCEAYFQRAWAYSILLKNFKEVPLIVDAYVNDDAEMSLPKASESQIVAQIKKDVESALATQSAKGYYEEEWQTKGRATKWALYALMADVCLWNHDYDEAIRYANEIIDAKDVMRPVFIPEMTRWYEIFYPGLSNESIFELCWDYNRETKENNFTDKFASYQASSDGKTDIYNFTRIALHKTVDEAFNVLKNHPELNIEMRVGRMLNASYVASAMWSGTAYSQSTPALWKYRGTDIIDKTITRVHKDANFILYRVAEILLIKAEALVMKGESSWKSAIELINTVRERAGLPLFIDLSAPDADEAIAALDQLKLLSEVMNQRDMEFFGEAKRWYDLLRLARYDSHFAPNGTVEENEGIANETYLSANTFGEDDFKYKQVALSHVIEGSMNTSASQLRSVLNNSWAWYLPIPQTDIDSNDRLVQNPYYE